jgi:rubrerythrin
MTNRVEDQPVSKLDRVLAKVCWHCPMCRRARQRQRGAAFWLVQQVETRVCPFCRAYARVHGRQPHEPVAAE